VDNLKSINWFVFLRFRPGHRNRGLQKLLPLPVRPRGVNPSGPAARIAGILVEIEEAD
jgi:hypothetical protein